MVIQTTYWGGKHTTDITKWVVTSTICATAYILYPIYGIQNVSQTDTDTDVRECATVYMVTVMQ